MTLDAVMANYDLYEYKENFTKEPLEVNNTDYSRFKRTILPEGPCLIRRQHTLNIIGLNDYGEHAISFEYKQDEYGFMDGNGHIFPEIETGIREPFFALKEFPLLIKTSHNISLMIHVVKCAARSKLLSHLITIC